LTVLVTGANGFLGSNLAKFLSEREEIEEIVSIGQSQLKRRRFPKEVYFSIDLKSISNACIIFRRYRPKIVFDFASVVGGNKFINSQSALIMHDATIMNLNVLDLARKIEVKKILFASSACVYPKEELLREEYAYPIHPENMYGLQKIFIENVYREYQKTYGIETYLPRFQNIYGPYIQYSGDRAKGLADICRKVLIAPENGDVELFGDGQQIRDYTFSEDAMDGVWKLINSKVYEPINISSGKGTTIENYARKIMNVLGKNLTIKFNGQKDTGIQVRISSSAKAKELIDWESKTSLEDGILKMANWIKKEMGI